MNSLVRGQYRGSDSGNGPSPEPVTDGSPCIGRRPGVLPLPGPNPPPPVIRPMLQPIRWQGNKSYPRLSVFRRIIIENKHICTRRPMHRIPNYCKALRIQRDRSPGGRILHPVRSNVGDGRTADNLRHPRNCGNRRAVDCSTLRSAANQLHNNDVEGDRLPNSLSARRQDVHRIPSPCTSTKTITASSGQLATAQGGIAEKANDGVVSLIDALDSAALDESSPHLCSAPEPSTRALPAGSPCRTGRSR